MPVLKSLATRAPGGARLHSRECQGAPMSVSAVNSNSNVAANTPQNSHTVQHGDTLSAIARQNGVSLAALLAANPQISNPGLIYPGDSIDIPSGNADPADAANGPAAPATDVSPANGEFDYNRISGVEGNPNVTPEFINEVEAMAARLGTKPEYLMAVMSFETGGSFSPAQANNAGSGADRKSTRLNSSHSCATRMPSSA